MRLGVTSTEETQDLGSICVDTRMVGYSPLRSESINTILKPEGTISGGLKSLGEIENGSSRLRRLLDIKSLPPVLQAIRRSASRKQNQEIVLLPKRY